jgi:hypothetical protein
MASVVGRIQFPITEKPTKLNFLFFAPRRRSQPSTWGFFVPSLSLLLVCFSIIIAIIVVIISFYIFQIAIRSKSSSTTNNYNKNNNVSSKSMYIEFSLF